MKGLKETNEQFDHRKIICAIFCSTTKSHEFCKFLCSKSYEICKFLCTEPHEICKFLCTKPHEFCNFLCTKPHEFCNFLCTKSHEFCKFLWSKSFTYFIGEGAHRIYKSWWYKMMVQKFTTLTLLCGDSLNFKRDSATETQALWKLTAFSTVNRIEYDPIQFITI